MKEPFLKCFFTHKHTQTRHFPARLPRWHTRVQTLPWARCLLVQSNKSIVALINGCGFMMLLDGTVLWVFLSRGQQLPSLAGESQHSIWLLHCEGCSIPLYLIDFLLIPFLSASVFMTPFNKPSLTYSVIGSAPCRVSTLLMWVPLEWVMLREWQVM